MAFDKLVDSAALDAGLTLVADVIRAKGEVAGAMAFPGGFVDGVNAIPDHIPKGLGIKYIIPCSYTPLREEYGFAAQTITVSRENVAQLMFANFDLLDDPVFDAGGMWAQHIVFSMCKTSNYKTQNMFTLWYCTHGAKGNSTGDVKSANIPNTALSHTFTVGKTAGSDANYIRRGENYRGLLMVTDPNYTGFPIVDASKLGDFLVVDGLTAGW